RFSYSCRITSRACSIRAALESAAARGMGCGRRFCVGVGGKGGERRDGSNATFGAVESVPPEEGIPELSKAVEVSPVGVPAGIGTLRPQAATSIASISKKILEIKDLILMPGLS